MKWIEITDRLPQEGTLILLGSTEHTQLALVVATTYNISNTIFTHWAIPTPPTKPHLLMAA